MKVLHIAILKSSSSQMPDGGCANEPCSHIMTRFVDARAPHVTVGRLSSFTCVEEGSKLEPRVLHLAPQPQMRALSPAAWVLRCPAWERVQERGRRHCKAALAQSCQALVWQCECVLCLICPCARLRSLLWGAAGTSLLSYIPLAGAGLASGSITAAPPQLNSMQVRNPDTVGPARSCNIDT